MPKRLLEADTLREGDKPKLLNLEKLKTEKARFVHLFPPSVIEPVDQPSVYQGPPLTLEDMQLAIEEGKVQFSERCVGRTLP
jgi:hypothetical protein